MVGGVAFGCIEVLCGIYWALWSEGRFDFDDLLNFRIEYEIGILPF